MISIDFWIYLIGIVLVIWTVIGLFIVSIFWRMGNFFLNYTDSHELQLREIQKDVRFVKSFAKEVKLAANLSQRAELGILGEDIDEVFSHHSPTLDRVPEPSKGSVANPGILRRTIGKAKKLIVPETGGGTEPAGDEG